MHHATGDDVNKPALIEGKDPWEWMQDYDAERFGQVILDPAEQARWSRALMLGGLPYMWRKASVLRDLIYTKLAVQPGHRVLLIGECLAACGFLSDLQKQTTDTGQLTVFDITDEARDRYFSQERGRGG